jgi:hypothetical protein
MFAHKSALMSTKPVFFPVFGNRRFAWEGMQAFGHFRVLGTMNRTGDLT